MKIHRLFLVLTFCIVSLVACKKEQAELAEFNRNCSCAKEVSADFTIVEDAGGPSIFMMETETDTIFKNRNVIFSAKYEGDYTWYLGAEVLKDSTFSRLFNSSLAGQDIPVTLIVRKTPNNICFPEDDGYDSITKILHVSQYPYLDPPDIVYGSIEGSYRVKSDHLPDSFDIDFEVTQNFQTEHMFDITNFDGMGNNCIQQANVTGATYRQVWSGNTNTTSINVCRDLKGYIHNRLDGVTEMRFTIRDYENTTPQPGENIITTELLYLGRKL